MSHDDPPARPPAPGMLSIETAWRLPPGEKVQVEIVRPDGAAVRFEGAALRSRRQKSGAYRTRVSLDPPRERAHLSGELRHFRAATLLSMLEVERTEGELTLSRDERTVVIHLRDGQVVDAEEPGHDTARRLLLGQVCQWEEGTFDLRVCEVDRPNHLGIPTSALLLHVARLFDEHRKVA